MDKRSIGALVSYERNKNNISMQQLADGLCSVSALQRLESGERLPDFFVLERIIERLGKSVNKMEFLYNEAAYEIYYLREIIEAEMAQKNYAEVLKALTYYESRPEAKEALHRQYIGRMQAVVEGQGRGNHEEAMRLLEEAMALTVPEFDLDNLESLLLGEGELLFLLQWIQEQRELDVSRVQADGRRILSYIERTCQDEEARANVYSKAAWVLGTVALEQGKRQEALWYTLQGEKLLTNNGLLLHLPQYLERILLLTEGQDQKAYEEWKKQRDALKGLYEEYGEPWEMDQVALWENYRQQEVYLVSELFGQERKLVNQSQEKLADALEMDQKTISRIESGKYKPKPGTFQKMKEYLQIDRDICSTRIVVDDFALLEMEREIAKLNHYRKEAEAEKLYQQLKEKLSLKWNENRQYIRYMDILFACELGRMTPEEAIEPCIEAFQITRGNVTLDCLDEVVLSRMEAMIVNYIANCYKQIGKVEKEIELREKIVHGYENSRVDLKYHYVALALSYSNLADDYEEINRFETAIEMCERSIQFDLRCKRGLHVGYMLSEKMYAIDRMTGDRSSSKNKYLQAYQILKLTKKERKRISLQKAYRKWYGEEIDS